MNARRLGQVGVDACLLALAYYLAYVLRFDSGIPARYESLLWDTIALTVAMKLVIFAMFGLYSKLWRFVDQKDFESILKAVVVSTVGLIVVLFLFSIGRHDPPRGVLALDFLLSLVLVSGARFAVRAVVERPTRGAILERAANEVLIVGAGNGGQQVAFELRRNPGLRSAPVGLRGRRPAQAGHADRRHQGARRDAAVARILDGVQPDEVIIAIPSAPGTLRAQVVTECRERGIPVRTLPTTFELLSGGVNLMRQVREVRVEDVLGREPVRVEIDRVGAYLRGRTVLVTGAGGSIGAELCRQIARVGAKRLVLVEHSENALFEIRRELEEERHFARTVPVLADCKDATRMREVFTEHEPSVVFHAAAYKHVPLMEDNPVEAVRNNAVATRIVAAAAGETGTERFVLVSTDKAVSPATVMGASKALAEWAVEAAQYRWKGTRFSSVRFGNVLGSSGSVVPIFRRQIAQGGPVTVTDEKMTRYFMTIPEAVQLIIRSGELSTGGEVFVLEMGDPVKIIDLAQNMIRLAGPRARGGHRRRDHRAAAGREDPRGALQPRRASAGDAGRQDRRRREAAARAGVGRGRVRAHRGAGLRGRRSGPRRGRCGAVRGAGTRRTRQLAPPRSTVRPLPEIVQEIGAYAGLAAVAGLAVLSVLYFSQARDVKRLREWAGRAPERAADFGAAPVPGRVVAQPQPGQPRPPRSRQAAAGSAAAPARVAAAAGAGAAKPGRAAAEAGPAAARDGRGCCRGPPRRGSRASRSPRRGPSPRSRARRSPHLPGSRGSRARRQPAPAGSREAGRAPARAGREARRAGEAWEAPARPVRDQPDKPGEAQPVPAGQPAPDAQPGQAGRSPAGSERPSPPSRRAAAAGPPGRPRGRGRRRSGRRGSDPDEARRPSPPTAATPSPRPAAGGPRRPRAGSRRARRPCRRPARAARAGPADAAAAADAPADGDHPAAAPALVPAPGREPALPRPGGGRDTDPRRRRGIRHHGAGGRRRAGPRAGQSAAGGARADEGQGEGEGGNDRPAAAWCPRTSPSRC